MSKIGYYPIVKKKKKKITKSNQIKFLWNYLPSLRMNEDG